MLLFAIRNLWEHKLRTALLAVAIVAGVAFIVASFVFTDTLGSAFTDVFSGSSEGIDITVRGATDENTGPFGVEAFPRIPLSLSEDLADVDGVGTVTPNLQDLVVQVTEETANNPFGPPTVAQSWPQNSDFLQLRTGEAPSGPTELVINAAAAEESGLSIGDTVTLATDGPASDYTLVGTFGYGEDNGSIGTTHVGLTYDAMEDLLDTEGMATSFELSLANGATVPDVLSRVETVLPSDVEAVDARAAVEEQSAQLEEGLSFFNTFLLVFAVIALIVGAFVVYNAFQVVVAQRGRELALLRVLGSTRRQLVASVLGEAALIGVVASLLGTGAGVLLAMAARYLLEVIGAGLPEGGLTLSTRTVVVGLAVGVITTLLSALVPALRTTRISPMEALRDQPDLRPQKRWWGWVGFSILVVSVALGLYAVLTVGDASAVSGNTTPIIYAGASALGCFIAMFLLARSLVGPVIGVMGRTTRGVTANLATENARRAPRRTATTASALMIGLGLVATVAVLVSSVEDTIIGSLEEAFASDATITAGGFNPLIGMSTEVGDTVAKIDGVESVDRQNMITISFEDGETTFALGVNPETVETGLSFESIDGSLADLGEGDIAVQRVEAESKGLEIGDRVPLTVADVPYPGNVVAIFEYAGGISDSQSYFLGYDVVAAHSQEPTDLNVSVGFADGIDPAEGKERLLAALEEYPTISVMTVDDILGTVRTGLNALIGMIGGLLLMSVVVA
ncbi:MAG: FtsX-like permease family protein, partial [Acidimicrobiia bacterium]|nr:FtsX-like permease family protein [Acidimicrobiia bacterium]